MRVTSPWKIAGGYVSTNHTACAVIPHLSDGRFGHEFEPSDGDPAARSSAGANCRCRCASLKALLRIRRPQHPQPAYATSPRLVGRAISTH